MRKNNSYLKFFIATILLIMVFTVPIPKKVNTACLMVIGYGDCKGDSRWILGDPLWKIIVHYLYPTPSDGGIFCAGFTGIDCPNGYKCKYDGKYPDAGGVCVKKLFNIF